MNLEMLHRIDEELTKEEVHSLKFLSIDIISRKRMQTIQDAQDLFLWLSELDMLNDEHFLSELLYTIGRCDLLAILGTSKKNVEQFLQVQNNARVSAYRKMLFKVSEEVTDEHLRIVKFFLCDLPRTRLEKATFLEIMVEMEKKERLGEENLEELENILDKCSKRLSSLIKDFRKLNCTNSPVQISKPEESLPINESYSNARESTPIMESSSLYRESEFDRALSTFLTDAEISQNTNGPPLNQIDENDFYPMNHRPLGFCLIINNYDFSGSGSGISNRTGTDVDRDTLTRVFERINFLVEERRDLKSEEFKDTVSEFAKKDHSDMDAFVCCILSHGDKGSVIGVDGCSVSIRELTQEFAYCQTLRGKPKLFFIQACQGKELQKAVWMEDGISEQMPSYVDDAKISGPNSIPNEADFLIGMATVENYKSFRHTTEGSIYIQELCKQLEFGCPRNEDILSILTKVNANVSARVLSQSKQMPEPRYTLTKKLVLPMD